MAATVDHVIVGAGTAGCVVAERLSVDPSRTVLLLEAGPDFPDPAALPSTLTTGDGEGYDWGLSATVTRGRVDGLARGKVVGGSAQINGRGALRALPTDYDGWAARGMPAWSWERTMPAFCRAETDRDFPDVPYHGDNGPVPIVRANPNALSPPMAGFLDATLAHGHRYHEDMNAPGAVGIGPYPHNQFPDGSRASTAATYLSAARARRNLTVRADAHVDRVVIDEHHRAVGVDVAGEIVTAGEVILAAGSPLTPSLLLRSGIGPAEELNAAGIAVRVDLPGVGRDLYDQPGTVIPAIPAPGAVTPRTDRVLQTDLIARLDAIPGHPADQSFYLAMFIGPPPGEEHPLITLMVGDLNPRSRGRCTLTGADPGRPPTIELNFYATDVDLDRMRRAYRHAWAVATHPAITRHITGFAMVDDNLVADDDRLDAFLHAMTFSRLAVLGGAAMGPGEDPNAVVDEHCRVHGVDALRVIDLSIVPVPLRAPTALDAIAIAEHATALMAQEHTRR